MRLKIWFWPRRQKIAPDPMSLWVRDWPTRELQIVHKHEYGQRPAPAQARTFQTWIEVNGMPVTARMTIDTWGSGAHFTLGHYWRHFLMEVNDGKWEPADIVLRVVANS